MAIDAPPSPEEAFRWFEREIDLLESAGRTGDPIRDRDSQQFYGMPFDDFTALLISLRDEIEERAYVAIVAATEAVVLLDFRARADGKPAVPLRDRARELKDREKAKKGRIQLEEVLDIWKEVPGIQKHLIGNFKQILLHRHWLAHGRYFPDKTTVPEDPGFAIARARALLAEFKRVDDTFPRS